MGARVEIEGTAAVLATFQKLARPQNRLRTALAALMIEAQRVVKQKLSGPVLRNRTGHLRASIMAGTEAGATDVSGYFGVPKGPTAIYGRVHEFGWSGTQNVKAHLREITQVFGRPLEAPVTQEVSAHTRSVSFPARSYLRTTLEELRPKIVDRLGAALREEIRGA